MKNDVTPVASPVSYQISELVSVLFMMLYMITVLDHAHFLRLLRPGVGRSLRSTSFNDIWSTKKKLSLAFPKIAS